MLFLFFNNQETSWKTKETFKSFLGIRKSLSKKKILIEQKQSSV